MGYSAPEQVSEKMGDVDRRTDVYQLGALTYELLTGRLPFETDRPADLHRRILEEKPAPPSSVETELPAAVDAPVMKALEKEKEDRHETAILFRNALRNIESSIEVND